MSAGRLGASALGRRRPCRGSTIASGEGLNSFIPDSIHPFALQREGTPSTLLRNVAKCTKAFSMLTLSLLGIFADNQELSQVLSGLIRPSPACFHPRILVASFMHIDDYYRKQPLYDAFAQTVAAVLAAAIEHAGGYRLQVVRARAKDPASLRTKLTERGQADADDIDQKIKDLAGCRAIFYANGDIEKLIVSGLVDNNFEVVERRIHQPSLAPGAMSGMYTANHYVVTLKADRLALPEYARFAGMRCEIQLQTILNHAWAEIEHDIIYKRPSQMPHFGKQALDSIKQRLRGIATKYLVPAGYEFDKVIVDFDRLVHGKTLLDRGALTAISQAGDNNARYEAIESFSEHVLSLYDEPEAVIAEVIAVLSAAAEQAATAATVSIDTPFGVLAGKSFEDIAGLIGRVLRPHRYLDVSQMLAVARRLHRLAKSSAERKPATELAQAIAKPNLTVWNAYGPAVQRLVVEAVAALDTDTLRRELPLLAKVLESILDLEATSTTFSSSAVALNRGALPGSAELAGIRDHALHQLERMYASAQDDSERNRIVAAMGYAARPPYGAAPTLELSRILIANAVWVIDFFTGIVGGAGLEQARVLEQRVHRYFNRFRAVRPELADDPELVRLTGEIAMATARFRTALATVPDLSAYKVLVGFDSVFPPSWEDQDFDHEAVERFRAEQADALLAQVDAQSYPEWLARLAQFALTESIDAATFMKFGPFLQALARKLPAPTLAHLDRFDGRLRRFLFWSLAGLLQSPLSPDALSRIAEWLERGELLREISRLLIVTGDLPEDLFRAVLASSIAHADHEALKNVALACEHHFSGARAAPSFHQSVLLEALANLVEHNDNSWAMAGGGFWWYCSEVLQALDDRAAQKVLEWLVLLPELDNQGDHVIAAVCKDRPLLALDLIDRRLAAARADAVPRFVAIPYELHETTKTLRTVPEAVLVASRRWFDADKQSLDHSLERLLETVFEDFPPALRVLLEALVASLQRNDVLFALDVLGAIDGREATFGLVGDVVAQWADDEDVMAGVHRAIAHEGMTVGFDGRVKALTVKRAWMEPWLTDPRERVRNFAQEAIHDLEQRIAGESRRTQAMLASRRMQYGEDPLGSAGSDMPAEPHAP
jgi:ppGpp synthetase/RelA/SpoT-type nucleotidyltranferase